MSKVEDERMDMMTHHSATGRIVAREKKQESMDIETRASNIIIHIHIIYTYITSVKAQPYLFHYRRGSGLLRLDGGDLLLARNLFGSVAGLKHFGVTTSKG